MTDRFKRSVGRALGSLLVLGALFAVPTAQGKPQQAQGLFRVGGQVFEPSPCKDPGGAALLPPNFSDEMVIGGFDQAVGLTFDANGRMFVWERAGRVWIVDHGIKQPVPLIDLSEEVGSWSDHGLMGVALDPDFLVNGYVYLLYVVDRHHLLHFGTPAYDPEADEYFANTIGRLTRYTANLSDGFSSVDPNSRKILIGRNIPDGIPICDASYGTGMLVFGDDGTLLVGAGDAANDNVGTTSCLEDGIITAEQDVGVLRSQMIDSQNGKLLRIDPATGEGLPSNPFFDALDPLAARSRVWTLGLRQHFRFALRPGSGSADPGDGDPGTVLLGDVGQGKWEELDVIDAGGLNLGWPIFEGMDEPGPATGVGVPNPSAPNPLFGLDIPGVGPCTHEFFDFAELLVQDSENALSWPNPCDPSQQIALPARTFVHHRPAIDWFHFLGPARAKSFDLFGEPSTPEIGSPESPVAGESFAGNCSIGGIWYDGRSFPPEYQDSYFHADFGGGWIRRFSFDENDRPVGVELFAQSAGSVVALALERNSGDLYYIDFNGGLAAVHRIFFDLANQPPVALIGVDSAFGVAPLSVQFDAGASSDPEGQPLTYRWSFGDGAPPSFRIDPFHTFPTLDVSAEGTIVTKLQSLTPPEPMGLGNPDPEVIRDGVYPALGSTDYELQFDTFHANRTLTGPDKGPDDWIGYVFPTDHEFTGLFFQEGVRAVDGTGGWFEGNSLEVQVRDSGDGQWYPVTGLDSAPLYLSPLVPSDLVGFQTFELRFDPVFGDGIRIYGQPGGIWDSISVGELRALTRPPVLPTKPVNYEVALTVTDNLGNTDCSIATLSVNNAPPIVTVTEPVNGSAFSNSVAAFVSLAADVSDTDQHLHNLSCSWQVVLHHDNHTHPEPAQAACTGTAVLQPHESDPGDVLYYETRLTVRDSLGLETVASAFLYPTNDCNFNGVDDALDIALGTSLDLDLDTIPDECQTDCNLNGIHDLFDIVLGTSSDVDENSVPDECE